MFYRGHKLGATEHNVAKADMFPSNLQGLAEPCQHGTRPPDKLSASLMLSPLTNQDSHRQTVFLSCALWQPKLAVGNFTAYCQSVTADDIEKRKTRESHKRVIKRASSSDLHIEVLHS